MKKINIFVLLLSLIVFLSTNIYAQRNYHASFEIKSGSYFFNTKSLYFFDAGIDCYLFNKCVDVDTVFENTASKITIATDTVVKVQAYLYTDTYEYMYVELNKKEGWVRADIPLEEDEEIFLKRYLLSSNFESYCCYVEIIPFKKEQKIFISTTDDWYIANLNKKKSESIGTKRGRLEACKMIFSKNCVKCYIDLGWGQEIWYDDDGRKK